MFLWLVLIKKKNVDVYIGNVMLRLSYLIGSKLNINI